MSFKVVFGSFKISIAYLMPSSDALGFIPKAKPALSSNFFNKILPIPLHCKGIS